jgi:mannitol-specific phosphotransferase system IIBC component
MATRRCKNGPGLGLAMAYLLYSMAVDTKGAYPPT